MIISQGDWESKQRYDQHIKTLKEITSHKQNRLKSARLTHSRSSRCMKQHQRSKTPVHLESQACWYKSNEKQKMAFTRNFNFQNKKWSHSARPKNSSIDSSRMRSKDSIQYSAVVKGFLIKNQSRVEFNKDIQIKEPIRPSAKGLTWENFRIGKRIVNIGPVISKKQQDCEYKQHKKLVKLRRNTKNKSDLISQFRVTCLKGFKNCRNRKTSQNLTSKLLLTISFQKISFNKFKRQPTDQIQLLLKYLPNQNNQNKQNKKPFKIYTQKSQIVPCSELTITPICFNMAIKHDRLDSIILIQINQIRSLHTSHQGCFAFNFGKNKKLEGFKTNIYQGGKCVGNVEFSASKKENKLNTCLTEDN